MSVLSLVYTSSRQVASHKNDAPPLVVLLLSFGAYIAFEAVQSALVQLD